jgi:hypothetical protein
MPIWLTINDKNNILDLLRKLIAANKIELKFRHFYAIIILIIITLIMFGDILFGRNHTCAHIEGQSFH